MTAILLLFVLNGHVAAQQWDGNFYYYLKDHHALVLSFVEDDSGDGLYGTAAEIIIDNGFSRSVVSLYAELTKKGVAEDSRGYSYTLKGDTLTVKYVDKGEIFGTDFSGTYKRGTSIEETFGIRMNSDYEFEFDDELETASTVQLYEFYYRDGVYGDVTLFFFDDVVDIGSRYRLPRWDNGHFVL